MSLKLYKLDASPASRSVMMICDIHKIAVQFVNVDYIGNEHLSEDYVKKNPLHTIPVLEDGDLILHDSHAMLTYLTEKYGKDDSLYPKDIKERALVDQKLYFDTLLFRRMRNITEPAIIDGVRKPTAKLMNDLIEIYTFTEAFLTRTKFIATDQMSVADICVVATLSSIDKLILLDVNKYPKTNAWFRSMEKHQFYTNYNEPGLIQLKEIVKAYLDL